jgi:hypothetical protein
MLAPEKLRHRLGVGGIGVHPDLAASDHAGLTLDPQVWHGVLAAVVLEYHTGSRQTGNDPGNLELHVAEVACLGASEIAGPALIHWLTRGKGWSASALRNLVWC